jgi:hypothetical protein
MLGVKWDLKGRGRVGLLWRLFGPWLEFKGGRYGDGMGCGDGVGCGDGMGWGDGWMEMSFGSGVAR